jgi:glycosyltransferase involved in cell wall biosynthesis
MRALYHLFDAFINISSGEALGIPFLEAAACGTRIVALNYGGHLDFLNKNNAYLVDYAGFYT